MKDYPEHSGPSQSRGSIITINSIVNPQKIVAFVAHHSSWFIIIDHTFNYLCLVGFWYDCKSLLDTISKWYHSSQICGFQSFPTLLFSTPRCKWHIDETFLVSNNYEQLKDMVFAGFPHESSSRMYLGQLNEQLILEKTASSRLAYHNHLSPALPQLPQRPTIIAKPVAGKFAHPELNDLGHPRTIPRGRHFWSNHAGSPPNQKILNLQYLLPA